MKTKQIPLSSAPGIASEVARRILAKVTFESVYCGRGMSENTMRRNGKVVIVSVENKSGEFFTSKVETIRGLLLSPSNSIAGRQLRMLFSPSEVDFLISFEKNLL